MKQTKIRFAVMGGGALLLVFLFLVSMYRKRVEEGFVAGKGKPSAQNPKVLGGGAVMSGKSQIFKGTLR